MTMTISVGLVSPGTPGSPVGYPTTGIIDQPSETSGERGQWRSSSESPTSYSSHVMLGTYGLPKGTWHSRPGSSLTVNPKVPVPRHSTGACHPQIARTMAPRHPPVVSPLQRWGVCICVYSSWTGLPIDPAFQHGHQFTRTG